jgi:hypothetical protein
MFQEREGNRAVVQARASSPAQRPAAGTADGGSSHGRRDGRPGTVGQGELPGELTARRSAVVGELRGEQTLAGAPVLVRERLSR